MKKTRWIGLVLTILFLTGCTVFQPRYPVKIDRIPEPTLPAPQSFQAVQNVLFSFKDRTMAGTGTLVLDRSTRSLELSCMMPEGQEFLHLRVKDGEPEIIFALPLFKEEEGLVEALAIDVYRIYSNNQPMNKDDVSKKGDLLLFDIDLGDRAMEYAYMGEPPVLVSKRYCGLRGVEAKIDYSDYIDQGDFGCIGTASLKNRLYDYQLVIQTKEITIK